MAQVTEQRGEARRRRMAGIGEEPSSFVSISELIKYTIEARVLPSDVRVEEFDLSRETYSFRAYEVKPFLVRSNGTQGELSYTGFSATMLQSIANQSGFSYTFAEPNSTSIGRNGPLIDVANGVADATIGPIASLATSYQVSFTTSYLDTGLVLVTYQASSRSRINPKDMISWMDPFTWDVWGTIFAIITAYAIIMFYLERDDTDSVDFDAPEEQGARGLFKSFWLSSVTFIGQLQGHVPGSAMGRIFMQTTAFVAVIIASSYTANLATFLTASRVATAAAQLSSIHDAQSMGSKICVGSLSTASAVLGADYKRVHQVKITGNSSNEESEIGIQYMQDKKCAGMVMEEVVAYERIFSMSDPCLLRVQGPVFLKQSHAIAVRKVLKAHPDYDRLRKLKRSLNYYLTKMRIEGNIEGIFQIDSSATDKCTAAATDTNKIGASQVFGPLMVFMTIGCIALAGKGYQYLTDRKVLIRGFNLAALTRLR